MQSLISSILNRLPWIEGRQKSGYAKLKLVISQRFKFDSYILRLPNGTEVPKHTDPAIEGFEHHRINITIKRPCIGTGEIFVNGPYKTFLFGRGMLFRPDLYEHWMTPAEFIWSNESMYILSIGWLIRK